MFSRYNILPHLKFSMTLGFSFEKWTILLESREYSLVEYQEGKFITTYNILSFNTQIKMEILSGICFLHLICNLHSSTTNLKWLKLNILLISFHSLEFLLRQKINALWIQLIISVILDRTLIIGSSYCWWYFRNLIKVALMQKIRFFAKFF